MTVLEKITKYYNKGIYTDAHLAIFLSRGIITENQYTDITLNNIQEVQT